MNGPRWKQRDIQYQRHVQKVSEIVYNQKKTLGIDQNLVRQQQSLYNAKSFNIHFNENQRLNQINKQNQLLLDKLIDISEGKQCSFKSKQFPNSPTEKTNLRAISSKRKQAAAMAQRLLNQRSFINKVQIMKEIDEYEKLRVHMQKVKPNKKANSNILQPNNNLPPIIQHHHHRNNTGNHIIKQRKLKKQSNNLNKSAYYIDNDNSLVYNTKIVPNLNQTEADIIINQYDTAPIQNSNSQPSYQQSAHQQYHLPPYQQSHSANIYTQNNQREGYTSKPGSVRSSSQMTPTILEEQDQIQTNQNQNFYKVPVRSSTQSHKNNIYDQQQNNNQNFSFDKPQNVNESVSSFINQQNTMNGHNDIQNPSHHQSYNQSQQNTIHPTQQQSLQNSQLHQNHQPQLQSNQQTQQQLNYQSQHQSHQLSQNPSHQQSMNQSYHPSQNQSNYQSQYQSQQQSQIKIQQQLQQVPLNHQSSQISQQNSQMKNSQKLDQYQLLVQNTQK